MNKTLFVFLFVCLAMVCTASTSFLLFSRVLAEHALLLIRFT